MANVTDLPARRDRLAETVRHERDAQISHFESLDTKAGILIGFAGVVVLLASNLRGLPVDIGKGFAATSALVALWAFVPRRYPVLDLSGVRNVFSTTRLEEATARLVDTEIEMFYEASRILESKGRRLKLALIALAMAVVLVFAGILMR